MSQLYRTLTGQSQRSQHSTENGSMLQKTTTTDPLSGVLNHLTEAQELKLEEFKTQLAKGKWWTRDGVNGKPSHDDGTLLRYLRARKFDVQGAIGQFTDTEKWLKDHHVEELYENFDVEIYERARQMYPQWTGRRDRRGIPIYVYHIKGLDSKSVAKYQKESDAYKKKLPYHKELEAPAKMLPLFALYHNLLNFILPLVSTLERPNPEIPVTNSTNIVDITGVGLTQFWNLKGHMQDASVLATAHYPETLDRIFIIGAPSFFPTVWGWIKRWFDPVTVSKIFILGKHEVQPTLTKFMDPKNIPKRYGGELDYDWGDLPNIDEETREALEKDGIKGWVRGPCLWLESRRVKVGAENGVLRRPPEVDKMKPVVYAADDTEVPVHPHRKASSANGSVKASSLTPAAALDRTPSTHAVRAAQVATAAAAGAATGAATGAADTPTAGDASSAAKPAAAAALQPKDTSKSDGQKLTPIISADIRQEDIRTAPMGGSQVHLPPPNRQAAFPMQTAEYIDTEAPKEAKESVPTPESASAPAPESTSVPASEPASVPAAASALATGSAVESSPPIDKAASTVLPIINGDSIKEPADIKGSEQAITHPHPPGLPQPGKVPQHTVEVTKAVAAKLEGESVSSIPATANGSLAHPEIIVSSDKSKGLAVEKEKLEGLNGSARPNIERFVTAAEF